jgi:hypothetical protein
MAVRRRKKKRRYHTGVYVSKKTGQACRYRSGWELSYLKWLDSNVNVKTFLYESVKIPYISNIVTGRVRHYYPDFLIEFKDGSKQLVEIKPKRRVSQAKVQKKLKAAEAWCLEHGVTLQILTEVELKVMGLL